MSLASILNDNDDISFPEAYIGTLTADTITARVINGGSGGGGGGNFSTPSQQPLDMNVNQIENIYWLNITNQDDGGTNLDLRCRFINNKNYFTIQQGNNDIGIIYDTLYNPLPTSGGAIHTKYVNFSQSITGATIYGTHNLTLSKCAKLTFPTPCTLFKMSINILALNANYKTLTVPAGMTQTLAFMLANANGTLDGGQNSWGYTFTPVSNTDAQIYSSSNSTTIDLWYASPAPTASIALCFQSSPSLVMVNASLDSIVLAGLITGYESTTDTAITLTTF